MITPWLEAYWRQCSEALAKGRLHHGLLISGCAGLGKSEFALALAQKILCTARENEACGHCQSCHWFAAKSHPDFLMVAPEEDKKQISIGQIRELSEALTKTGYGNHQVVIIQPAEAMNRAAANAFLKTLEEPCGEVILILVSDHPASLLPTLRSRCQELRVQQPPNAMALLWLKEALKSPDFLNNPVSAESKTKKPSKKSTGPSTSLAMPSAEELLALADGLPLQALKLAQTGEWQAIAEVSEECIQVLTGQLSALKAAEKWSKQSVLTVLNILTTVVHDMIRLLQGYEANQIQHRKAASALQAIVQRSRPDQLAVFLSDILKAKRLAMSTANPNPQMLFESIFLRYFMAKSK